MNALDTPIWQLTPRELFAMQEQWLNEWYKRQSQSQPKTEEEWVTLERASELLDRAKTTLYRYMPKWEAIGAVRKIGGVTQVNIKTIGARGIKVANAYKNTKRTYNYDKD